MSSKLLRSSMLKQLRRRAKLEPEALKAESEKLCDKLYAYIMSQYFSPALWASSSPSSLSKRATTTTTTTGKHHSSVLYVLSYLPLYYEVDLRLLMRRLWQNNETHSSNTNTNNNAKLMEVYKHNNSEMPLSATTWEESKPEVCVMVPIVLDPTVWLATSTDITSPSSSFITSVNTTTKGNSNRSSIDSASIPDKKSDIIESNKRVASGQEWPTWLPCAEHDQVGAERLRGAMMFVEVFDDLDLQNSFVEQGKFHILELKRELLNNFFVLRGRPDKYNNECSVEEIFTKDQQVHHHTINNNTVNQSRVRRSIFTRSFASLFPDYVSPIGELYWHKCAELQISAKANSCNDTVSSTMLVLAPGVYFERTNGARVGKGGGYYDRFIHYHRSHSTQLDNLIINNCTKRATNKLCVSESINEPVACLTYSMPETSSSSSSSVTSTLPLPSLTTSTNENVQEQAEILNHTKQAETQNMNAHYVKFEVIGIGFDEQVNRNTNSGNSKEGQQEHHHVKMQEHDECVDYVVTPTYGVEKTLL